MRVLVLGAGAVGGYFGGRLAASGTDVTFLVRPARAARLRERGLRIESPLGDVAMPVQIATADTLAGAWDVILLTAKAYDLGDAIAAIRPAVGSGTAIVPFLNGLAHLDRLDTAFGREPVLGGVAYIGATLAADGTIRHLNRGAGLTFGERQGGISQRVRELADAFAAARVSAPASEDILQDMWAKFVLMTTLAGMSCLLLGNIGEIMEAADGEALMLEMLGECAAVAAGSGHPMRPQQAAQWRALLTERGSDFTASTHRDLEAGRRTEGEAIVGDMLRRARALGVAAPLLRVAACRLEIHERRRARAG